MMFPAALVKILKRYTILIGKNIIRMILLLTAVSIVSFALMTMSPVDPLQANVGQAALGSMSQEQIEKLESYWGVDEPPVKRYLSWAKDFIHGDFGMSLQYRQPVSKVIAVKLGNSLFLMVTAWVLSGVIGFALGILAGVFRGRLPDRMIKGYCVIISSTPAFWLALLLLMIFGVWLKVLPIGLSVPIGLEASGVTFLDRLRHAILPALTLSITGISNIALHTREKMIDVMESDYVLFARARGESTWQIVQRHALRNVLLTGISNIALHTREKMIDVMESDYVLFARARGESTWQIVQRHALRNVLLPAITLQFASISEIFGGSVLVEQVFSYAGMGQAAVTAGLGSDMPLLMAITIVSAMFVFGGNLIAVEQVFSYAGMGQAAVTAGLGSDMPLLMAITIVSAMFVFGGNLIANILYGVVDPRIRRGGSAK